MDRVSGDKWFCEEKMFGLNRMSYHQDFFNLWDSPYFLFLFIFIFMLCWFPSLFCQFVMPELSQLTFGMNNV